MSDQHAHIRVEGLTMAYGSNLIQENLNFDINEGDVFVIFDVRRYENNTLKLAEMAEKRGAIRPL